MISGSSPGTDNTDFYPLNTSGYLAFAGITPLLSTSECLKDGLRTGNSNISSRLNLCVGDLAMVDYHGVATSTIPAGPANALGELGVGIGREELSFNQQIALDLETGTPAISSLMPLALAQALMTQASLNAITMTRSTPLDLISERCSYSCISASQNRAGSKTMGLIITHDEPREVFG